MPKVLVCASTGSHIRNFHLPYLRFFKEKGFEVHVAVPENEAFPNADRVYAVPIKKRIGSIRNLLAALEIRRLVRAERYELVLAHTNLAAFVTRLGICLSGSSKPKLINTVHGYFFWDGCGFIRKALYYVPELLLRGVTDCIITMNGEDAAAARKLVKKGGHVVKVHGMGVDASRFQPADDERKRRGRQALCIPEDAFVLVYPAEFSKRKNHYELLCALDEVRRSIPEALLLLCGTGALENDIRDEVKRLDLEKNIRFMGWCTRMEDIYPVCDMAISSSRNEGLPFNIMEAQLSSLPTVASRIRGHIDLIQDGKNGRTYTPGDPHDMAQTILSVCHSHDHGKSLGAAGRESALEFSLDVALAENTGVYMTIL